jgi:hypothetical protein
MTVMQALKGTSSGGTQGHHHLVGVLVAVAVGGTAVLAGMT